MLDVSQQHVEGYGIVICQQTVQGYGTSICQQPDRVIEYLPATCGGL